MPLQTGREVRLPRLKLVRYGSTPHGTFGKMTHEPSGWSCYTVERPWEQNKPAISCIPAGLYGLTLGTYHKHDYPAYELRLVPGRANIKIHIANVAGELEGCIAPGKELGCLHGWAVIASKVAFDELMALPAPEDIFITWQSPEEP